MDTPLSETADVGPPSGGAGTVGDGRAVASARSILGIRWRPDCRPVGLQGPKRPSTAHHAPLRDVRILLIGRWGGAQPLDDSVEDGGAANAFRLTMAQRSPGFPAATVASDSRSPVQVPSGASAFLGPGTPPGAKYGSSAGNPYLVLRARGSHPHRRGPRRRTPSTPPTPDTGWAFVLGDLDADQVAVSATDATGATVSAAEVDSWFAGTFNYAGGTDHPRGTRPPRP